MKIAFSTLALALAVSLFMMACAGAATPEPERPPLKVRWTLWPGFYPMTIAVELGLFEKHNVKVEPLFYKDGVAAMADFSAEKLDGIMTATGISLPLATQTPLKIVLVLDNSAGADQVVAVPDITTVADLRGKRVGLHSGGFGELFVHKMLEANGLTANDIIITIAQPETVPEALPGLIDAGHTWEPHTSRAVAAGNHVIFSSAETPGLIHDVLIFHASVVEERPDDIRGLIAAWFEALAFWEANPEETAQMIAKHTGLKPEEISTEGVKLFNLEDNKIAFARGTDTTSLYISTQEYVDFFIAKGYLSSAPDLEQLIDPSFLE